MGSKGAGFRSGEGNSGNAAATLKMGAVAAEKYMFNRRYVRNGNSGNAKIFHINARAPTHETLKDYIGKQVALVAVLGVIAGQHGNS